MNELFLRAAGEPGEIKASITGEAIIDIAAAKEGEAQKRPAVKMNAYNGGLLRVAGFYRPVIVDLAGMRAAPTVALLKDHDPSQLLGQATKVEITASGVVVDGVITGDNEATKEVLAHARNGFKWPVSIGAAIEKLELLGEEQTANVNGRSIQGPAYIARKTVLRESTLTAIGADESASSEIAASAAGEVAMTFEQWLKATYGLELAGMNDALKAKMEAEFKASQQKPATTQPEQPATVAAFAVVDPIAEVRKAAAAESKRLTGIRAICAKHAGVKTKDGDKDVDLEAHAIEQGWTVEATELVALRAARQQNVPGVIVATDAPAADVLEAACVLAGKMDAPDKQGYSDKVLSAAQKQFRRGIGLQELLLHAAWENGYTGRTYRGNERDVLRAAFSTHALSGILSNVANKFLLAGFGAVEDTWRAIAAKRSVNDFKAITSYRMLDGFEFEEVGPGGELKHGELSEESFSNQAKTYGKMFAITYQDQRNDDLGALTAVPRGIGRGYALKFNKVFWTAFMDNASFFTGADKYFEGAATALSITSLGVAETMFLNKTDANGDPLAATPKILLVPNAISTLATTLTRDTEIRDTTASTKYTTSNPHAGKFTPVRSSYLSNSAIAGYSTTAWYLLADPNDLAVIEACFLDGQETPTVESADADFNVLGIQMRGFGHFGVTKQDARGGVKSKGAA